jgi:hypothetical protein
LVAEAQELSITTLRLVVVAVACVITTIFQLLLEVQ